MKHVMKRTLLAAFAGLMLCSGALAAPAHWHKWRSKLNGKLVCAQTSPGDGWEKETGSGPYRDGRCKRPVKSERPA